jgi:hypothetical protein
MGIKTKYTDPSINEFATDDIIINVISGSLFFKSNTNLYKLQGDNLNTPTTESGGDMWVRSGSNLYYNDGKVGIGTTNPTEKLVVDSGADDLIARFQSTTAEDIVKGIRINAKDAGGASTYLDLVVDPLGNKIGLGIGTTSGNLPIGDADLLQAELVIDSSGNVGIYTNSPIAPLTVRGDIASGGVSTGGTDQIVIHSTTNAYGAGIGFCDHLSGSVVANQTYANGQKGHLRFFHSDVHNDTGTGCVFKLSHENATSLALDVEGNVVCATLTCTTFDGPSDINLKTNVNNIDTPLETILKLKGITFEWKEKVIEKEPGKRYTNLEGTKHGFIAQEVEKVLPDLINDEKPYKSLNYIEIIPILVEAMKEQQKQIDELKRKINEQ